MADAGRDNRLAGSPAKSHFNAGPSGLVYFTCAAVFALLWVVYLFRFKSGIPSADDLNFFIPAIMGAESMLDPDYLLHSQGPHFHFSYKIMSYLLLEQFGYNTLVFSATGPLALIGLVMLIRWYIAEFERDADTVNTQYRAVWTAIGAVMVAFFVFTPLRSVDFSYDMLALNGNLAYVAFTATLVCTALYLRRRIGHLTFLVVAIVPVFIVGVATFKTFYAAGFAAMAFVSLPDIFVRARAGDLASLPRAYLRHGVVIAGFAASWLLYDALLAKTGYRAPDPGSVGLADLVGWVRSGVYQSLGGATLADHFELADKAEVIKTGLLVLCAICSAAVAPFLIARGHIVVLALMGHAVLAAIGAGLVRGVVEAPRYQGVLSFFWLGVLLAFLFAVRALVVERSAPRQHFARWSSIAAAAGAGAMLLVSLASMWGYAAYLQEQVGYTRRYMSRQAEIFYGHPVLTEQDAQALRCRRPLEMCQAAVDLVRQRRAVRISE